MRLSCNYTTDKPRLILWHFPFCSILAKHAKLPKRESHLFMAQKGSKKGPKMRSKRGPQNGPQNDLSGGDPTNDPFGVPKWGHEGLPRGGTHYEGLPVGDYVC